MAGNMINLTKDRHFSSR